MPFGALKLAGLFGEFYQVLKRSKAPNALWGTETTRRWRGGARRGPAQSKAPNALWGTETGCTRGSGRAGSPGSRAAKHLMPFGALRPVPSPQSLAKGKTGGCGGMGMPLRCGIQNFY
jgi:hypothetical protein